MWQEWSQVMGRRSFQASERERHGDRPLQSIARLQSQESAQLIPGLQSRGLEARAQEAFRDDVSRSQGAGEGRKVEVRKGMANAGGWPKSKVALTQSEAGGANRRSLQGADRQRSCVR